jgi:hypothetical protein
VGQTGRKQQETVKGYTWGDSRFALFTNYYSGDLIEGDERWAGRVARVGRREMHREFWWGNLKAGDHVEDLSLAG